MESDTESVKVGHHKHFAGPKVHELFSKPYRGHLRCASQDLSSDNSCSRSHRTCISSAKNEVDELGENMRNKA